MESVTTFSQRFHELIDGESYQNVASRLGISKSTVGSYITGEREPKAPVLSSIARAYGVSPAWLAGYDAPKYAEDTNDDLREYLDVLRTRPECRMLFSLAKDATKEDVERAVAVIGALKGTG